MTREELKTLLERKLIAKNALEMMAYRNVYGITPDERLEIDITHARIERELRLADEAYTKAVLAMAGLDA